ncbi:myosin [Aphelenchoides avenae]|nr:myosin [Aphelenchus avenae]
MTASDERADIQEAFFFYDKLGDGKIALTQVGSCLRSLGLCPTEGQIAEMTQQWANKDARISVEEFTPIYRNLRKDRRYQKTPEELADCLANFDRDGNGLISVVDLRFILTSCGEQLTDRETEILIQGQDSSEGKVNIHEFIRRISE